MTLAIFISLMLHSIVSLLLLWCIWLTNKRITLLRDGHQEKFNAAAEAMELMNKRTEFYVSQGNGQVKRIDQRHDALAKSLNLAYVPQGTNEAKYVKNEAGKK